MRRFLVFFFIAFFLFPLPGGAEDFLGVPVLPDAKTLSKSDSRLEMRVALSHDEIIAFYKKALKGSKDIKYREWSEATYIEDDGNRPWHSITISKNDGNANTVVIAKDNWTWIIGTLILRYVGVFVVLIVLFIAMAVSGGIISRSVKKVTVKKAE